ARAAVRRVRRPDLRVVVGDAVRVPASSGTQVVARVVPGDGHGTARLVEGDGLHELAVRRVVVVQPDGRAPGRPLVVGVLEHDVDVVVLVRRLLAPDEVDAPVVRAAGPVPGEVRLGVDRAVRLGGDVVEPAHPATGGFDSGAEAGRSEAVGVDRGVDVRLGLAACPILVRHHD